MEQLTLKNLNASDSPETLGGELLSNDGTNQLWIFRSIDKVANRFQDEETSDVLWSADVAGWGYDPSNALS